MVKIKIFINDRYEGVYELNRRKNTIQWEWQSMFMNNIYDSFPTLHLTGMNFAYAVPFEERHLDMLS